MTRATQYFQDVLGFEISDPVTLPEATSRAITGLIDAKITAVFATRPDLTIEFLQFGCATGETTPPTPQRAGYGHLALYTDDLEALLARSAPYGRRLMAEIFDVTQGPRVGWRICYTVDDDGFIIEFAQPA